MSICRLSGECEREARAREWGDRSPNRSGPQSSRRRRSQLFVVLAADEVGGWRKSGIGKGFLLLVGSRALLSGIASFPSVLEQSGLELGTTDPLA